MATAGPALPDRHTNPLVYRLGEQEQSVLSMLLANQGRVISRRELARTAGSRDSANDAATACWWRSAARWVRSR